MKDISTLGSKIPVLLIIGSLVFLFGCDMGTYGRRMKDKAKPVQTDTDQVPASDGNAIDQEDSTDE